MDQQSEGVSRTERRVKLLSIASLTLNIVVLIPICALLAADLKRMENVYGPKTEARGILLSMISISV